MLRFLRNLRDSVNPKGRGRVEVYEDEAGEWRWRLIAGGGREVATSEQSYASVEYAKEVATARNPGVRVEIVPWQVL